MYFDILIHYCVQRSFTSTTYPGTHTSFIYFFGFIRQKNTLISAISREFDE